MVNIFENVIKKGDFELADTLKKINNFWVKGDLTDEQHAELTRLAQEKANPNNSIDIFAKLNDLETRVQALEAKADSDAGTDAEEYPEYVAGKWYHTDDKASFEGKQYICIAPNGAACVWSPSEYPTYWSVVE